MQNNFAWQAGPLFIIIPLLLSKSCEGNTGNCGHTYHDQLCTYCERTLLEIYISVIMYVASLKTDQTIFEFPCGGVGYLYINLLSISPTLRKP